MSIQRIFAANPMPSLRDYMSSLPSESRTEQRLMLPENELMTDYGNAQRFVHHFGDKVRYCSQEDKWYIWSGRIWKIDSDNQVEQFAFTTAKRIVDEIPYHGNVVIKKNLQKWSQKSMDHARVVKMLKSARSMLTISPDQLDGHGWLLNVENGTIDLKTGTLKPHDKNEFITKLCDITYASEAEAPLWLRFLERIFDGDREMIRFMQKVAGYCLTGDTSEKCFFIMLGEHGDNGKTVLLNVLMALLADYAIQTPMETIMRRKPGAQSNDLVRLKGARLISAAEANMQCHFDEALIKRLTGSDPITARALYREHITFKPEGKILIATNRVPRFDTEDAAFDKRIRMIPFYVSIPKEEQDKNLYEKLMSEAGGILAWAVEGCLLWQAEGLGVVPSLQLPEVQVCSLEDFIEKNCDRGENLRCKSSVLHNAYREYLENHSSGEHCPPIESFGNQLSGMGIPFEHCRDGNYRIGLSLRIKESDLQEISPAA